MPSHEKAFIDLKESLCKPPVLTHFDLGGETVLQTDASKNNGLGFVLLQKHDNEYKIVQCGSRFLTETDSRYAIVQLELLAVAWAMDKCKTCLMGLPDFKLQVDHRPLLSILDKKTLDEIHNPRLQRLKEKVMRFKFSTEWIQGKKHAIPDALSRSPIASTSLEDEEFSSSTEESSNLIQRTRLSSSYEDLNIKLLREEVERDNNYQLLMKNIQNGFPVNRSKAHPAIKPYWNIKDEFEHRQRHHFVWISYSCSYKCPNQNSGTITCFTSRCRENQTTSTSDDLLVSYKFRY